MRDLNSKETAYLAGMYDGMLYSIEKLKETYQNDLNPVTEIKEDFWKQFLFNLDARQRENNFFIKRDVIFDGGFQFFAPKQEGYQPKGQINEHGFYISSIPLTCSCGSSMESCEEDPDGYYSRFFITPEGPQRYLFELGTYQNGVNE